MPCALLGAGIPPYSAVHCVQASEGSSSESRGWCPASSAVGLARGHVGAVGSRGLPRLSPKALEPPWEEGSPLLPFSPLFAPCSGNSPAPRLGASKADRGHAAAGLDEIHDRNAVSRRIGRSIRPRFWLTKGLLPRCLHCRYIWREEEGAWSRGQARSFTVSLQQANREASGLPLCTATVAPRATCEKHLRARTSGVPVVQAPSALAVRTSLGTRRQNPVRPISI